MANIGKHIRTLRRKNGLTQETLAQELHVTRQAVSNWETGKTEPDLDTLQAIAAALDADLMEIIYGPGHNLPPEPRSYQRFQPRRVIRFAVLAALAAACMLLQLTLLPSLKAQMTTAFIAYPFWSCHFITGSFLGFSIGAMIPSGIALFADIHIPKQKLRAFLLALALILALLQLLIFEEVLWGTIRQSLFSGAFPFQTIFLWTLFTDRVWLLPGLSGFLWSLWQN